MEFKFLQWLLEALMKFSDFFLHTICHKLRGRCGPSLPVSMAHGALPVFCSHTAPPADAVAAAAAHSAWVPELSQGPLAAGAGPLPILTGKILCTPPPQILQLTLHPPEGKWKKGRCVFGVSGSETCFLLFTRVSIFCKTSISSIKPATPKYINQNVLS